MPNFESPPWLEVCQEPPKIISDLEDFEGSWLDTWRTWVILDILNVLHIWLTSGVPNFTFLSWLEVCQKKPSSSVTWRNWEFLTGDMVDKIYQWPHNSFGHLISNLYATFQHSSIIKIVSKTTPLSSVTWKVPEQRHEGHGSYLTLYLFLTLDFWPLLQISVF